MTDTNTTAAPKKVKPTIPAAEFKTELVSGSVTSLIKAAGATASKANEGGVVRFPVANIRPLDGFNVRIDTKDYLEHIDDLKASIRSEGFYPDKPLAGFAAKEGDEQVLFITDGYSRYRAVSEVNAEGGVDGTPIETLPVIIKPQTQTVEDLQVALILGNEGRPLSVYEKALVVKRLSGLGLTTQQIMGRLKMSDRYVLDLVILAGAPARVRDLVINNKVSATEAIKQLKKDAKGAADALAAGVKTAEAAGKKKASAKHVDGAEGEGGGEGGGEAKPKSGGLIETKVTTRNGKVKQTLVYNFKQGEIVKADAIRPVARFKDMEYWAWVDETTKEDAVIEESVRITVILESAEVDESGNERLDEDDVTAALPDATTQDAPEGAGGGTPTGDDAEGPDTGSEAQDGADEEL